MTALHKKSRGPENSPPQLRRGGCAIKKMLRSHLERADGVVLTRTLRLEPTTRPRQIKVPSVHFSWRDPQIRIPKSEFRNPKSYA